MATFNELRNRGAISTLTEQPERQQGALEQRLPEQPSADDIAQPQQQPERQQEPEQVNDNANASLIPDSQASAPRERRTAMQAILAADTPAINQGMQPQIQQGQSDAVRAVLASADEDERRAAILRNIENGRRTPADRAARVLELAQKTKLPVSFINDNYDEVDDLVSMQDFDVDNFISSSPIVADWIAQSDVNYALIRDDIERMGSIERAFRTPVVGLQAGRAQVEIADIYYRASLGYQLTEEDEARIAELDDRIARAQRFAQGEFGQIVIENAMVTPQLYGSVLQGGRRAAQFGIAGAAVGGAVGAWTGPGAAATAGTGLIMGAKAGFSTGAVEFNYHQMAGMAYREMMQLRDSDGNAMDHDVAAIASNVVGILGGGISIVPLTAFLRSFPGLENALSRVPADEVVKRALESPSVRRDLRELAGDYGRVLSTEVGAEMAQRAIQIIGEEIAKQIDDGDFDPRTFREGFGDVIEEGVMALRSMLLVSAAGPASRFTYQAIAKSEQVKRAEISQRFFEGLTTEAGALELARNNPAQFEQIMQRIAEEGGLQSLYIDTDKFNEVFQEAGLDVDEVAIQLLGDREAWDRAKEEGMLEIPTARYASVMAGNQFDVQLSKHLRVDPNEMTGAEAEAWRQSQSENIALLESGEAIGPLNDIYNDVLGQLVTAYPRDKAEFEARRIASMYMSLAQEANLNPWDYYQERPLQIRTQGPDGSMIDAITQEDLLVNRLRDGDIPTESEVFGESVTEWMRRVGILPDHDGGELAGRDVDVGAVGRNQMMRPSGLLVSIDDAAEQAHELGYISSRDADALLDAVDRDLAGERVYSPQNTREDLRAIADGLEQTLQYLERIGVDNETMSQLSNQEIMGLLRGDITPEQAGIQSDGFTTFEQAPPIDTPEFSGWFGESQVVDSSGQPLVVYHGSRSTDFESFDFSRIGEQGRTEGQGFYFTDDAETARGYGPERAFYLSIQNPLSIDADGFDRSTLISILRNAAEREAQAWDQDVRDGFLSGYGDTYTLGLDQVLELAAGNILEFDSKAVDQMGGLIGAGLEPEHLNRAVMDVTGHDGVISDGYFDARGSGGPNIFVAFTPEQIKSVDNRGTFDPESSNIFYQEAVNNQLMQAQQQQVRELFQFAGERAATADLTGLSRAIAMANDGANQETIRQESGWHKGLDGKWRFEISDADARIIPGSLDAARNNIGQTVKLGDVLQHDQLYNAYPELKNIDVVFSADRGTHGSFKPSANLITLTSNQNKNLIDTLIHEIQHAIQTIEGFAIGGSPSQTTNTVTETPIGESFYDLLGVIQELTGEQISFTPSMLEMLDNTDDLIKSYVSMIPPEIMNRQVGESFASSLAEIGYTIDPEMEVNSAIELISDDAMAALEDAILADSYENYERLAGEIEARATAARSGLDDAGRRDLSPRHSLDIAENLAIIEFDGNEVSFPIREQALQRLSESGAVIDPAELVNDMQEAMGEQPFSYRENNEVAEFVDTFGYWQSISAVKEGGSEFAAFIDAIAKLAPYSQNIININESLGDMPAEYLNGISNAAIAAYSTDTRVATIVTSDGDAYLVRNNRRIQFDRSNDNYAPFIVRSFMDHVTEIRNNDPEYIREQQRLEAQMQEVQRREDRLRDYPALTGNVRADFQALAEYAENFAEFKALIYDTNMFDISDRHKTRLVRILAALDPDSITADKQAELADNALLDPRDYYPGSTEMEAVNALRSSADKLTIYRGMPKGSKIESGDWVSFSRSYAKGHESNADDGGRTGQRTVPREHIYWYGADINEWVYINPADLDGIQSLEQLWDEYGQGKPDDYPQELFMFAGKRTAPWMQPNTDLQEAQRMLDAGASMENVRRNTGWFRGTDGNWRFEITDHEAFLSDFAQDIVEGVSEPVATTLQEVMHHERLFMAYPWLRDVVVAFESGESSNLGSFQPDTGVITLTLGRSPMETFSTLLHEVQHAIQLEENWSFGGMPDVDFARQVKAGLQHLADGAKAQYLNSVAKHESSVIERNNAATFLSNAVMYREIQRLIGYAHSDNATGQFRHIRNQTQWFYIESVQNNPELKSRAKALESLWYNMPKKHRPRSERNAFLNMWSMEMASFLKEVMGLDAYSELSADGRQINSIVKAAEREYHKHSDKLKPMYDAKHKADTAAAIAEHHKLNAPFEIYYSLTGEVESRNTQQRMHLTEMQRRNESPALIAGYMNGRRRISVENMINVSAVGNDLTLPMPAHMRSQLDQQPTGDRRGARGSLMFGDSGPFIINLFEKRNLSTLIHETGHLYVELLGDLVQSGRASETQVSDFNKLMKFAGATSRADLTVEGHEKLARAFEMYSREGRSPSMSLRDVFAAHWKWLNAVYPKAERLNVTLTDEVREVFDRAYATEEEIALARESIGDGLLFKSAEEMGVTQAAYDAYVKAFEQMRLSEVEQLHREMMAPLNREQKKWWKQRREEVRKQVLAEMNETPVYRALSIMQRGKLPDGSDLPEGYPRIKLNKQSVLDQFGKRVLNALPRPYVYSVDGGVSPAEAAEFYGFESGHELITEILNAKPMREAISQEVERRLVEQYGDPALDGTAADIALDAVHSQQRGELLARQLKAMAKKTKKRVTPLQVMREQAEQIMYAKRSADTKPHVYRRAEQKAAREAIAAAARGDNVAALEAMQRQLFNHELYRAAKDMRDMAEKVRSHMARYHSDKTRGAIGKAGHDYLQQIDGLMERYEFRRVPMSQLEKREALRDWVRLKEDSGETMGEEMALPDYLLDESNRVNYRELTNLELEGLYDTVRQIEHYARLKNRMLASKAKADFNETVDNITNAIYANNKRKELPAFSKSAMTRREKMSDLARQYDAGTLVVEQLVEWFDGEEIGGPMHQAIFNPASQAQALELDLTKQFTVALLEKMNNIPKDVRNRMLEPVDFGTTRRMVRRDLISVALNAGTESNYRKMIKGMGWDEALVERMIGELTKEEMQFVQGVWDSLEGLWPYVSQLEKDMKGIEPERVEARVVKTRWGEFRGGYYPMMYDPMTSEIGERQMQSQLDKMHGSGYVRATTPQGHTKKRSENFAAPINLDIEFLPLQVAGVIKDISHRRFLMDAYRIINNDKVRQAINETMGPQYNRMMSDWLTQIAQDRSVSDLKTLGIIKAGAEALRLNFMVAAMGIKATTLVSQWAGFGPSVEVIGGKEGDGLRWFAPAIAEFFSAPKKIHAFITEKSGEMRHRIMTKDRDLRHNINRLSGKSGIWAESQSFAMQAIGLVDLTITLPTWLAAYKKALNSGFSDELAIQAGDKAVRMSQGAGGAKDLSAFQAKNNFAMKALTMFYTPFRSMHNRMRNMGHNFGGITDVPQALVKTFWLVLVPGIFGEIMVGRGPAEDEDNLEWAARAGVMYATLGMPIFRDLVNGAFSKYGYTISPVADTLGRIPATAQRVAKYAWDDDANVDLETLAKDVFTTAGFVFGIPGTAQLRQTGTYLYEVVNDEREVDSLPGFVRGVMYGPPPE